MGSREGRRKGGGKILEDGVSHTVHCWQWHMDHIISKTAKELNICVLFFLI